MIQLWNCVQSVFKLRERHENSKNLVVSLPIIVQNVADGQKIAAVDPIEVSRFLDLDRDAIAR